MTASRRGRLMGKVEWAIEMASPARSWFRASSRHDRVTVLVNVGLTLDMRAYTARMSELKTKPTSQDVAEYLNGVAPEEKRRDGFTLLDMMQRITGEHAVMWGPSIVGFGVYHYKSERSRQEGDWPLVGFSPRKQNLSLYVLAGSPDQEQLLANLGKHKAGVGCLYVKRLSDIDEAVLATLVESSFRHMKQIHGHEDPR